MSERISFNDLWTGRFLIQYLLQSGDFSAVEVGEIRMERILEGTASAYDRRSRFSRFRAFVAISRIQIVRTGVRGS